MGIKQYFEIAFVIVTVLIVINWFFVMNMKTRLAVTMKVIIILCAVSVLSNLFGFASESVERSYWFYAVFFVSIDWMLWNLAKYLFLYIDGDTNSRIIQVIMLVIMSVDTGSLLFNAIFRHSFLVEKTTYHGAEYNVASQMFWPYDLHLAICYILAAMILFMLIQKSIKSTRFYRRKYISILLPFICVLIVDGASLFFKIPVNYSVLAYALLVLIVRYYTLSYEPKNLVTSTVMLAVENMDAGVICFDMNGKYAFSNKSLWGFFGRSEEDSEAAEELYRSRNESYLLDEKDKYRWDDQFEVNGEKVYLICEYSKIYDEDHKFVGSYFHISNVSDRVKENEQLRKKYENENEAKSVFVSRISHEIRTPINSVYGMNEMILRECTDEHILEYSRDIKNATETIINIVNDVLDYSKIESGKMELINVDYRTGELFEESVAKVAEGAKAKGLDIITDIQPNIPEYLVGDCNRLKQILLNLLTNAVKYTKEGHVKLSASCRPLEDDVLLSVAVSDTGVGIRKEDISKLYIAYDRVEEVKHHSLQGTGLGINITVQLLKMMGAELIIDSEFGKGSTFSFTVKQKIAEHGSEPACENTKEEHSANRLRHYEGKNFLIVDDSATNRKVLKMLLKISGAKITEAAGGIQGMQLIRENKYDLIFLDHMMPDLNGVELFERLKSIEHINKDTPFVMVTANVADNPRQRYLDIGFDNYIAKPIRPQVLEEVISELIDK